MSRLIDMKRRAIRRVMVDEVQVVRRLPSPLLPNGRRKEATDDTFMASGSFQPVRQKRLNLAAEGTRNEGDAKFYTDCELQTQDLNECNVADNVLYKGVRYRVDSIDDWEETANYFKVTLTRMGQ